MKLRRDILLFAAVVVAAAGGGWWLLAKRPGAATESFRRAYAEQQLAAKPRPPSADAFRGRVCERGACVAVEAGGLTFIFGAGESAAEGVTAFGLMDANVDGVLLPDLAPASVSGLPGLAAASGAAGRGEPLKVYGPAGSLPIVDGANLMASGALAARLAVGLEGENQGLAGQVVFDSGVVLIRGFGGQQRGAGRVYRVEFDGKSLILAGCTANPADIVTAARGAQAASGILMASSHDLAGPTARCTDLPTVLGAVRQGGLLHTLLIPVDPPPTLPPASGAWAEILSAAGVPDVTLGVPGASLDLAGQTPRPSAGK